MRNPLFYRACRPRAAARCQACSSGCRTCGFGVGTARIGARRRGYSRGSAAVRRWANSRGALRRPVTGSRAGRHASSQQVFGMIQKAVAQRSIDPASGTAKGAKMPQKWRKSAGKAAQVPSLATTSGAAAAGKTAPGRRASVRVARIPCEAAFSPPRQPCACAPAVSARAPASQ